jgi:hypothetical protein
MTRTDDWWVKHRVQLGRVLRQIRRIRDGAQARTARDAAETNPLPHRGRARPRRLPPRCGPGARPLPPLYLLP